VFHWTKHMCNTYIILRFSQNKTTKAWRVQSQHAIVVVQPTNHTTQHIIIHNNKSIQATSTKLYVKRFCYWTLFNSSSHASVVHLLQYERWCVSQYKQQELIDIKNKVVFKSLQTKYTKWTYFIPHSTNAPQIIHMLVSNLSQCLRYLHKICMLQVHVKGLYSLQVQLFYRLTSIPINTVILFSS